MGRVVSPPPGRRPSGPPRSSRGSADSAGDVGAPRQLRTGRPAPTDGDRDEPPGSWRNLRTPNGEEPPIRLPESPFGRFAFAHAVGSAGDTLVTIALAGSLFFNVSLGAARGQVFKYLIISLTPFLLLAPFIGPLIDRFSAGRKWIVVGSFSLRAFICLFMAGDLKGVLLFPEAFAVLVLSKTYTVARSSLVPAVIQDDVELVRANSRLSLLTGFAGFLIALPGGLISKTLGSGAVLWLAAAIFVGAALASLRITTVRLFPSDRRVLVINGGEPADEIGVAQRAHDGGPGVEGGIASAVPAGPKGSAERKIGRSRAAQRQRQRGAAISIRLAGAAMAILRGEVGFMTFLVAFTFKDDHVSKLWLGFAIAAGAAGSMIGAAIAPRLRIGVGEERMVVGSVGLAAVISTLAVLKSNPAMTCVVALAVGLAAATARVAFDALIQRDGPPGERASTFARFETRFQLFWVIGALLAILPWERFLGFLLMGATAAATIALYLKGEPALEMISSRWDHLRDRLTSRTRAAMARRSPDPLGDPFSDT